MSTTTTILGALPPNSGLVLAILSSTIPFIQPAIKPPANFLAADKGLKRLFAEAFLLSILASIITSTASLAAVSRMTASVLQCSSWSVTAVDDFSKYGGREWPRTSAVLDLLFMVAQVAWFVYDRLGGSAGAGNGNRHGRWVVDVVLLPSFGEFVGLLRETEVAASSRPVATDQVREEGAGGELPLQRQDVCEEEPTCMVCWSDEPSARPKLSPCGHLICLDCLVRLKDDTRDYCLCPYFRRPMFAVVGGASGLQI